MEDEKMVFVVLLCPQCVWGLFAIKVFGCWCGGSDDIFGNGTFSIGAADMLMELVHVYWSFFLRVFYRGLYP